MKYLGTSLKLNRKQIKILGVILFLGVFIGYLLYKKIDASLITEDITNICDHLQNTHLNFIFIHVVVLCVLIATSLVGVGIFLLPLYFVWELACVSYSVFIFQNVFGVSGLIYGLLYNIIIKMVYFLCLFLIFKNVLMLFKRRICGLYHGEDKQVFLASKQYRVILINVGIILIYDILLHFLGNQILAKLCFLI